MTKKMGETKNLLQAQLASAQSCDPSNPTTGVTWPAMVTITISIAITITITITITVTLRLTLTILITILIANTRLVCTGPWRWCWPSLPAPSPHPTQGQGRLYECGSNRLLVESMIWQVFFSNPSFEILLQFYEFFRYLQRIWRITRYILQRKTHIMTLKGAF